MPDNRDGAPPVVVSDEESAAAIAELDTEETAAGQDAPAASAAATDGSPGGPDKPAVEAAPEKKPVWEDEGFKSPEDMAKSYKELRTKFNARDKEISALRDGREELGSLKKLILPEDDAAPGADAGAARPAAGPQEARPSEAAQDPVESIRTFMGPEAADFVNGLQEEVKRLRGDFDSGRRASENARNAQKEQRAGDGISQLIEDVGAEEYARVMRNPRYEQFAARQVLVDGLPAEYVYAGLAATLNAERAGADRSSSGRADSEAGGGSGALPPGGKPGGPKEAAPQTELEKAYAEMQEAAKGSSEGFWGRGRDK